MHEWALADAVLAAAQRAAAAEKLNGISAVTVVLGELQNIDTENFRFIFKEARKNYGAALKNARLKIAKERAELQCNNCGFKFAIKHAGLPHDESEAIHFIPELAKAHAKCPKCSSPDFKIVKGRGVYLKEITGDR